MTLAFERLIDRMEPELAKAIRVAFEDMRRGVDMPALVAALEANDSEAVIDALNLDDRSFVPWLSAVILIYMRSGAEAVRLLRRSGLKFTPVDIPTMPSVVGDMIQQQTEAAQAYVADAYSSGKSPRQIAKELRTRIGLSRAQQSWVDDMRKKLEQGDKGALGYKDRDKRYDSAIKRAAIEGKPLPQSKIDEITEKYSERLLRKRATNIAAAETASLASGARKSAVGQALRKAGLPDEAASKTWRHSSIYLNARVDHVDMSGRTVQGLQTPFVMADGVAMQYAHDPKGGAKHNAGCRCTTRYSVNWGYGR